MTANIANFKESWKPSDPKPRKTTLPMKVLLRPRRRVLTTPCKAISPEAASGSSSPTETLSTSLKDQIRLLKLLRRKRRTKKVAKPSYKRPFCSLRKPT